MPKKANNGRQKPFGALKGSSAFCVKRFARKLANCLPTSYAGRFSRSTDSVPNPAQIAHRYNVDEFRHDYLLYNVVRKYNDSDKAGADKRAKCAFEKFLHVDSSLAQVNLTLNFSNLGLNSPVVHRILWRAARKMERLLGELDLSEVRASAAFSHGATMLHSRKEGRAPYKFSFENPEVTPQCARLAWAFIEESPVWSETVKSLTLVGGNRLTTVPKDTTIDRVIACEPTMNMYIQKGIGAVMRNRLKRVGIDLNDQSKNQDLAMLGSRDGHLATVDLSAASDSISLAICELLLPTDWYDLLLMTRSDVGFLPDGTQVTYNKISSMGNGFTFELESAIFWVITQACEDEVASSYGRKTHRCSVYGDDIVCRVETVPLLRLVLEQCGFKLNIEKSFFYGPFRESCGKHYFNGIDVSPFFVRSPVTSILDLIGLCNRLRRWNRQCLGIDDPRYVDLYNWCVRQLPLYWQKAYIPDGLGDGALYGYLDEVRPHFSRNGYYKAPVLLIRERQVTKNQRRYESLADIFFGVGGYTAALRNLEARDVLLEAAGISARGSYEDVTTALLDSSSGVAALTAPGELQTKQVHVRLAEWSDSCPGSNLEYASLVA